MCGFSAHQRRTICLNKTNREYKIDLISKSKTLRSLLILRAVVAEVSGLGIYRIGQIEGFLELPALLKLLSATAILMRQVFDC